MERKIILDTDFLSSFIKIERLELIKAFYQVEHLYIPLAVYKEIARTDLLSQLLLRDWMVVEEVDKQKYLDVYEDKEFASLGSGEQESILLALASPGSSLLMSDNKARRITKGKGINVINIPAFLLACKLAALLSKEEIKQIIQDLKQKDYYEFKTSEREELLR